MTPFFPAFNRHLSDATALVVVTTPFFVFFETIVAGLPDSVSFSSRLLAAGLTYAGLGFVLSRGRDLWRRLFHITDTTAERWQQFHDALYMGLFDLFFLPFAYFVSGSRELSSIAVGALTGATFSAVSGGPAGYCIDAFRDLFGLQKTHRLPAFIRDLSPTSKKLVLLFLAILSVTVSWFLYWLTS